MALDEKDCLLIKEMIVSALATREEERRARFRADEAARPPKPQKPIKTYLVTFAGHCLGLPLDNGKVVVTSTVYARLQREDEDGFFGGKSVEVIADGDGRLFKEPFKAFITGHHMTSLVEVGDDFLKPAA